MCTVWPVDKYKITFKLGISSRRISRGPAVEKRCFDVLECRATLQLNVCYLVVANYKAKGLRQLTLTLLE